MLREEMRVRPKENLDDYFWSGRGRISHIERIRKSFENFYISRI